MTNFLENAKETIRIMLIAQLYGWKSMMIYRTQFVFQIFYAAFSPLVTYIFMSVIYTATHGVPGWSFYQLLFLSSLVGLVNPLLAYMTAPAGLLRGLRVGLLDVYLIRPYSAFTALFSNFGDTTAAMAILDTMVLTVYALAHINANPYGIVMFLLLFLSGVLLLAMFTVLLSLLVYRRFRSGGTFQGILNTMFNYGNYPLSLYGTTATILLTLVLPIGFATYLPAEVALNRLSPADFVAIFASTIAISYAFYRAIKFELRGYTSAMG